MLSKTLAKKPHRVTIYDKVGIAYKYGGEPGSKIARVCVAESRSGKVFNIIKLENGDTATFRADKGVLVSAQESPNRSHR